MKLSIFFFLFFIPYICLSDKLFLNEKIQKHFEKKYIKNEKSFSSGSMGIGLVRSFETKGKKICIYNTVKEQIKKSLNLNLTLDCPLNLKN
tara:strand:- start:522 stop:794 length:273 start_codon:yes stop_codon:yes gene_type:complete